MSPEQVGYAITCYEMGFSLAWIADRIGFSKTAIDHQLKAHGVEVRSRSKALRQRHANRMDGLSGMNLERSRDLPTATNPITGR